MDSLNSIPFDSEHRVTDFQVIFLSYVHSKNVSKIKDDSDVDKWFEKMRQRQKITPRQSIQKRDEKLAKKGFQNDVSQFYRLL